MLRSVFARRVIRVGVVALTVASESAASTIVTQVSLPSRRFPHRYYEAKFQFPEGIREFSDRTLVGYSFRQDLKNGGVRELEISHFHSPGAYLMVTDLFPNGRFSTMSHVVMMVFPRGPSGRKDPYTVSEDPSGDMRIVAPDGGNLLVDVETGAVRATRDFYLAPQGAPGSLPGFRHRGFHLEITAVGKNPFLRGTPVTVRDATGETCRLSTGELFRYGRKPESDVFRFDTDAEFFSYLSNRCPALETPVQAVFARAPAESAVTAVPPGGAVRLLYPEDIEPIPRPGKTVKTRARDPAPTGALRFFRSLLVR